MPWTGQQMDFRPRQGDCRYRQAAVRWRSRPRRGLPADAAAPRGTRQKEPHRSFQGVRGVKREGAPNPGGRRRRIARHPRHPRRDVPGLVRSLSRVAHRLHVARRVPGLPRQAPASGLPIARALMTVRNWELTDRENQIAGRVVDEIRRRLEFLSAVGLDYLSLDRSSATLSGGEAQRIRLATQIGSKLRGVLYVLDEPSIGLHPRDNNRLLDTLTHLRDMGNTVLVVEHDAETIERADYVIDLGPGAGRLGRDR